MRRPVLAIVLLLTLALVVDSTGRDAWSQQRPPEPARLFGTETLLARSANGIEAWEFDGTDWRQLPNGPAWSDAGGWNAPEYYSTIQTGDIDGDGRDELLARSASGIEAWEFDGSGWSQLPNGPPWSDAGGWNAPQYYSTIQTGDIDGGVDDELLARSASGIEAWRFDGSGWQQLVHGPSWSDAAGWNAPEYYSTIQTSVVGGASNEELLARGKNNIVGWWFASLNWQPITDGPSWSDAAGWNAPQYYTTIQTGNINGGGYDELLARSASHIEVWWYLAPDEWRQLPHGPSWSDAAGWNAPEYYSTIQTADVDGDGRAELLARSASSIEAWEYEEGGWQQLPHGPGWSDAAGWNAPEYYSTIQAADIEGLPTIYLPTIQKP